MYNCLPRYDQSTPRSIPAQCSKSYRKLLLDTNLHLDTFEAGSWSSSPNRAQLALFIYNDIALPIVGVKLALRVGNITSSEFGSDVLLPELVCFSEKVDDAVATLSLRFRGPAARVPLLALLVWRLGRVPDTASAWAAA